jgi:hypothetical protein
MHAYNASGMPEYWGLMEVLSCFVEHVRKQ